MKKKKILIAKKKIIMHRLVVCTSADAIPLFYKTAPRLERIAKNVGEKKSLLLSIRTIQRFERQRSYTPIRSVGLRSRLQ